MHAVYRINLDCVVDEYGSGRRKRAPKLVLPSETGRVGASPRSFGGARIDFLTLFFLFGSDNPLCVTRRRATKEETVGDRDLNLI
jgi:hypothetical protein